MKKSYSIDRIEESFAVCIDEMNKKEEFHLERLPANVGEGDILIFDGENFIVDPDQTQKIKRDVRGLIDKLKSR